MLALPDLFTLRLCSMLASLTFAIMFFTLRLGRGGTASLGYWAGSGAAYAAVLVGFEFARGAPGPLAGGALFALLALSDVLILSGVRSFEGQRAWQPWMLMPVLAPGLLYAGCLLAAQGLDLPPQTPSTFGAVGLILTKSVVGIVLLRTRLSLAPRGRGIAGIALLAYIPTYCIAIGADLSDAASSDLAAMLPMLADQVLLAMLNLGLLSMSSERAAIELQHVALRDTLTGTWNRAWLHRSRTTLSVPGNAIILIDIDHFKKINDVHGHATGDEVLRTFARHANAAIAQHRGALIRLGGDEFVAVVPGMDAASADRLAGRLLDIPSQLAEPGLPAFTTSMGMTLVQQDDADLGDAIAGADRQLYLAKKRGRAQVCAEHHDKP